MSVFVSVFMSVFLSVFEVPTLRCVGPLSSGWAKREKAKPPPGVGFSGHLHGGKIRALGCRRCTGRCSAIYIEKICFL